MSETSTAALIPFDRIFRLTGAELKEDYRVNLFNCVKRENSELLGMFEGANEAEGEEFDFEGIKRGQAREQGDSEVEDSEADDNEDEEMDGKEPKKPSKQNKKPAKLKKKMREMDYDFDDPFIDDSEITDVYRSVFELMRGGGPKEEEEDGEEGEGGELSDESASAASDRKSSKGNKERRRTASSRYFVYRGTMTPEILAKEFEIDVNEAERLDSGEGRDSEDEDSATVNEEKRKRKRKNSAAGESGNRSSKKVKKEPKEPKELKKREPKVKEPKPPKEPKTPTAKKVKPVDLIAQSVKKFNDLYSNEDTANVTTATTAQSIVFNVNGVDPNLLELRVVIKKFRDSALGTAFSPGKFPSALRPFLNETICSVLRVCRPTATAAFPAKMFPALASFLPFSPAALNKLLTKKILGPLMESTEKSELPKMYGKWKKTIDGRIKEAGAIVEITGSTATTSETQDNENPMATNTNNTNNTNTNNTDSATPVVMSPVKRKLKFNDEMRQEIFEIIRTEIDLNNLIILMNSLTTGDDQDISAIRPVQSDLNLRKNVYQKLVSMSCAPFEMGGGALLSTTEVSKEFGAQKRKHEKKIAKSAGEIGFGEAEVEEFLKELDVKNVNVNVNVSAGVTVETAMTAETSVVKADQDPLNLFTDKGDNDMTATATVVDTQNYLRSEADKVNNTSSLLIDSNQ